MKTINAIKKTLTAHKKELGTKYKVKQIGVFGSFAKGNQKKRSDFFYRIFGGVAIFNSNYKAGNRG